MAFAFQCEKAGRWRDVIIPIAEPHFTGGLEGTDIALYGTGRSVFHMVEVLRGAG